MVTWINSQWAWIKSFISSPDGTGNTRSLTLLILVGVFVINYNRIAWAKQDLLDIPENWAIFLGAALAIKIADVVYSAKADKTRADASLPSPPVTTGEAK